MNTGAADQGASPGNPGSGPPGGSPTALELHLRLWLSPLCAALLGELLLPEPGAPVLRALLTTALTVPLLCWTVLRPLRAREEVPLPGPSPPRLPSRPPEGPSPPRGARQGPPLGPGRWPGR